MHAVIMYIRIRNSVVGENTRNTTHRGLVAYIHLPYRCKVISANPTAHYLSGVVTSHQHVKASI